MAYTGPGSYRVFAVGNYFNRGQDLSYSFGGRWGRHPSMYQPGSIAFNRWYTIRIEVRGSRVRCLR